MVYETNEGNAMMILFLGGSKHGQRHDLQTLPERVSVADDSGRVELYERILQQFEGIGNHPDVLYNMCYALTGTSHGDVFGLLREIR